MLINDSMSTQNELSHRNWFLILSYWVYLSVTQLSVWKHANEIHRWPEAGSRPLKHIGRLLNYHNRLKNILTFSKETELWFRKANLGHQKKIPKMRSPILQAPMSCKKFEQQNGYQIMAPIANKNKSSINVSKVFINLCW